MSTQRFDMHPADLTSLVKNPFIGVLGRKRLGKTTVARWITQCVCEAQGVNRFLAMCGNEDNMREWSTVIHPLFVQIADINKLEEIKKKQADIAKVKAQQERDARRRMSEHERYKADLETERKKNAKLKADLATQKRAVVSRLHRTDGVGRVAGGECD